MKKLRQFGRIKKRIVRILILLDLKIYELQYLTQNCYRRQKQSEMKHNKAARNRPKDMW